MDYREEKSFTAVTKQAYVDGLNALIDKRQREAENVRREYFKNIFSEQERYREEFKQMLGWPLTEGRCETLPEITREKIADEDGYSIYRMQFEIIDGLKMTGLFFKCDSNQKLPLVILQHGGQGTPELIAGMYGRTSNYNDMLHRVRRHGVHVFAPQLLLWSDEYGVDQDRKLTDARLKRVGSSVTAVEVYGIMRILDYFEAQSYVSKFGMVGLSYGGFYTLYTAAADTRIESAISCAFFNSRDAVGWSDWTWHKSAEKFDDAEVACLVYPRKLCIEIADNDPLFDCSFGVKSFENIKEICKDVGTDWIDFILFGGVHEFHKDDAPILNLLDDLK